MSDFDKGTLAGILIGFLIFVFGCVLYLGVKADRTYFYEYNPKTGDKKIECYLPVGKTEKKYITLMQEALEQHKNNQVNNGGN